MRKMIKTVALAATLAVLGAGTAAAQTSGADVTVVHGVPGLTVDVYVNGNLTLEDFEFGDMAGPLSLPAGSYDVAITAADDTIDNAVLTQDGIAVTDGLNASIIAHLQEDGSPTISVFVNDTAAIDAGNGRLTVRHTAEAPAVDILLADGTALFTNVTNPNEGTVDVPAAAYDVEIAPTGAGVSASVFSAPGTEVPEGTNRIVYAVGSLAGGTFTLMVQDVTGLGSAPAAVNTGSGDFATSSLPLAAILLTIIGAGMLITVTPAIRRVR